MAANNLPSVPDQYAQTLTPGSGDVTLSVLDRVFGPGWENLALGESVNNAGSVLFALLSSLNAVVIAAVAVIVIYTLTIGAVGTAHEGKPLGQRYHTLFTPLRGAFSFILLAPMPWAGGLSLVQALVLSAIWMGVGGGNTLTDTFADYLAKTQGAVVVRAGDDPKITQIARQVLESEVVIQYQAKQLNKGGQSLYTVEWKGESQTWGLNPDAPAQGLPGYWSFTFQGGPGLDFEPGDLGEVRVFCKERENPICLARMQATQHLINNLSPVAQAIVTNQPIDKGRMRQLINQYYQDRSAAIQALNAQYTTEASKNAQALAERIKARGWGFLGAWYWSVTGLQEQAQERMDQETTYQGMNLERVQSASLPDLAGYLGRYRNSASEPLDDVEVAVKAASSPSDVLRPLLSRVTAGISNAVVGWHVGDDPLLEMRNTGHLMIGLAETALVGGYAVKYFAEGAKVATTEVADNTLVGKAVSLFGGGAIAKTVVNVTALIATDAVSLLKWALLPILAAALALAFYLPAVPFILYSMSVIGWLILALDSVVAAVLWVAAHAIPEGEGMAGQHGRQGYMLFLNVLLRPALTVIGFAISWLATYAIGSFIMLGLKTFIPAMNAQVTTGVVTVIAMIVIGAGLMVIATHKTFDLVTWLPDNALRWIGYQANALGERNSERETNAMFAAAVNNARGAGQQMQTWGKGQKNGGNNPQNKQAESQGRAENQSSQESQHAAGEAGGGVGSPQS